KSGVELLCEQRESVQPPREIDVAGEKQRRVAHAREVAGEHHQLVDRAAELPPALLAEEVDGDRLDRPVVDPKLAPRISPRGQEQDGPAARFVQLGRRYLDLLTGKEGEHRQRIAELARLEALQERDDLVHARGPACARPSRVTPSPRWSQLSAELSGIQPPA